MKGAPYMNYDDALIWIECDRLLYIKLKMLSVKAIHSVAKFIHSNTVYTSNILSSALKGAMDIEQLPEKFKDINYSDNKKLKQILSKVQK